jgi:hypothetical protein
MPCGITAGAGEQWTKTFGAFSRVGFEHNILASVFLAEETLEAVVVGEVYWMFLNSDIGAVSARLAITISCYASVAAVDDHLAMSLNV